MLVISNHLNHLNIWLLHYSHIWHTIISYRRLLSWQAWLPLADVLLLDWWITSVFLARPSHYRFLIFWEMLKVMHSSENWFPELCENWTTRPWALNSMKLSWSVLKSLILFPEASVLIMDSLSKLSNSQKLCKRCVIGSIGTPGKKSSHKFQYKYSLSTCTWNIVCIMWSIYLTP